MQYTQYADKRDSRGSSSSSELANRQPAGRTEREKGRKKEMGTDTWRVSSTTTKNISIG